MVTASLAGSNQLGAKSATQLPPATLYDFTREELGSNPVLKLPASSFRYLHVKLSAGISPAQVKGASVYNLQETKAVWTSVGSCGAPSQVARTTVIICDSPLRVPVDRVRFRIDPKQVNFRRAVVLSDASEQRYGDGEITRVRMNRGRRYGHRGRDGCVDPGTEFRPGEGHRGQRGQSAVVDIRS